MSAQSKKPSRRQIGLNLIRLAGYHEQPYQIIAIEHRISYRAALEKYYLGRRQKQAGVKCGCEECSKKERSK
jgi:hypothetical protein